MTKKDIFTLISVSIIVSVIMVFLVGVGFLGWVRNNPESFVKLMNPSLGLDGNNSNPIFSSESAVIASVKKANPAVVAITISKNVPIYERYFERVPSPYQDFFGNNLDFNIARIRQSGTEKLAVGGGSGFLVSADGYIVTNRHVVEDTDAEYAVFTNDGKTYIAKVIARDPVLDLAVIKIEGSEFPYLPFGDSDTLEVGQTVIAIGNALAEFRNTVSLGIISGLSRSIVASNQQGNREALDQLIQTDAAINQGNSGGPLLNLAGQVIGVNVAVATEAENIGFALSSNSVKNIVESVRTSGKIIRP